MKSIFTENRTALITGVSAGMGFKLTKLLAHKLDALVLASGSSCRTSYATGERTSNATAKA